MYTLKSAAQMRQTDNTAMYGKYSIAPAVLMENAGRAVAERGGAYVGGWDGKDVLILAAKEITAATVLLSPGTSWRPAAAFMYILSVRRPSIVKKARLIYIRCV